MTTELRTDILIVGGGVGGVAAAYAALRLGKHVILTEETDWLGGQLTAQAVPPDENAWIEQTGCTASYRQFRQNVRDYYKRYYPLRPEVREQVEFNPGAGTVSRLCHEPRVALAVLEGMLAPYQASRQLLVLFHYCPIAVEIDADTVRAVTFKSEVTAERIVVTAPFVLDATELGDLLPLGGV